MDGFSVLVDPTRRAIADLLLRGESDVGGLVRELELPQPLVSKHLRILREAGAVEAEVTGKRRVYRLSDCPFPDVLAWMLPYAERWRASFDRLSTVLQEEDR